MELYYLITIIDRKNMEQSIEIHQNCGVPVTFSSLARGTATMAHLSLYNLSPTPKAVIGCVAGPDAVKKIIRQTERKLLIDIPGNGIMMTIPIKAVAGGTTLTYLTENNEPGKGIPPMEFSKELILVILNEGHADDVMDVARAAGAGGGTIVHAKGTGALGAQKFFGVSLTNEKEIIYIVESSEKKSAIMYEINKKAGPGTNAGAICFSLPISQVIGLRQFDGE